MNDLIIDQIKKDYKALLETEEGKRVFGALFDLSGLTMVQKRSDFEQGIFAMALTVANTVRAVDPLGVAKCEIAYKKMKEALDDGRDASGDE